MVGVLIIAHGDLGRSLADCARHILGREPENLAVMAVDKTDDPESKQAEAQLLVDRLDAGDGVVILTDMYGGTPSNIASRLIRPGRVEAVAGASLPMVVRALCYSSQPLEIVVSKAITGGLEGVLYIIPGEGNAAN
ncbi:MULTISPECIES: PTS sugar transporter subunit IIA [Chromobacterium]|uniref:PTS sugar transporter subunit IIA n=1 Tax=Chromobacterium TaxID=535 RepID=UPI0006549D26|nr:MULTISPECIES: PTS sugar transporter subunit IIA [Chromobacterium]KMN81616.1 PTS fructose transporter subunit IIA [Chromobacterium sp. LK11]MCS3802873.1 PTS system ascorbate-specific IIA component [Chromobacterium alkanivorans]MCS3872239.1 PTS system ascorbate-specific IIA component [Chromobacterium alkanivorans]UJB33434.1 PTS sugar transporter subunit IIA [Chromobacterium sp. Beijing]